jgi:predicted ATP-dependent protease
MNYRELPKEQIIYDFKLDDIDFSEDDRDDLNRNVNYMPEYSRVYENMRDALTIDKQGYNVYLIDEFSKNKLENIKKFINGTMKNKIELQDICYIVMKDIKNPKVLFLTSGKGKKLKNMLKKIQNIYAKSTYEFYNGYEDKQKKSLLQSIQKKRSYLISKIVEMSKNEGFSLKITENGFNFVPLKENGKMMNEIEYESLNLEKKEEMINKVSALKIQAERVLDKLKDMESYEMEKIKILIDEHYKKETREVKEEYFNVFSKDNKALEFLSNICNNIESEIKEIYSINYEDDIENIRNIIYRYSVNVLIDNSNKNELPIVFEEDPSINNLLGSIEYENKNGTYVTDASLIRPGSLLKANGGILVLRVSSLLSNKGAYYYLKKSIISGKVDLNYNRGYLELLSLSGLKPEPIEFNEKIILIGDYSTYDLLYAYDEDFKNMFSIRAECKSILQMDKNVKKAFLYKVLSICKNNKLHPADEGAIKELAKFLSRKAENRNKLFMDDYDLERILIISDKRVCEDHRDFINEEDIINTAYKEEIIENQVVDSYTEGKIFIDVKGKMVGQINALSIIDTGYFNFGKPIRITCSCYKGNGNIIDIQKESDLSGKIHNKAINILKGHVKNLSGGYNRVPVDFYLSFEQIYGRVDGDSASAAEIVSIISALTKIGIKQNIAVTGSINQFGEIQPIGGVNEKIEGFFKICKVLDTTKGKGVLIPKSNESSLALKNEVEKEIADGNFHIYIMSNLKDAVEILMEENYDNVIHEARKELKKYYRNKEQ